MLKRSIDQRSKKSNSHNSKSAALAGLALLSTVFFAPVARTYSGPDGQGQTAPLAEYCGAYENGPGNVVYVTIRSGSLMVRPIFWTSVQPLAEAGRDSFVVPDRPERMLKFSRDASGQIQRVDVQGFGEVTGTFLKLGKSQRSPVELLFENKGADAYRGLSRSAGCEYETLLSIGEMMLERFPTRSGVVVQYLEALLKQHPDSASANLLLGRAYVAAGDRTRAKQSLSRASELDPGDETLKRYCFRLGVESVPSDVEEKKWRLPFTLTEFFGKPDPAEIEEVKRRWRGRDLSVQGLLEVDRVAMRFGAIETVARIVSHRVHGFLHYGAIIVPAGAEKASCAVLVEAKGVSWNYFPLNLERGLTSPQILGPDLARTVLVLPSFRGERMIVSGKEYTSEGDRTDSWDGATDDALALLNVALASAPEADPSRIGVFGRSRGGSVALLAAIRDKRIKAVVEWAGPTEWFELMAGEGWTQRELVEEGLRIHARPSETAGQFIERFLLKSVEGSRDLKETRLKMIASSPLYFATMLPGVQIHHGEEDRSVPIVNAKALAESLRKSRRHQGEYEAYFYEGFGHDTDVALAAERSREFFRKKLSLSIFFDKRDPLL